MPDISMCMNEECPLKEECYRFTVQPNKYRQSYGNFKPNEEGQCVYYWNNKGYKDEHKDRNDD
jgi:hypothetical protein